MRGVRGVGRCEACEGCEKARSGADGIRGEMQRVPTWTSSALRCAASAAAFAAAAAASAAALAAALRPCALCFLRPPTRSSPSARAASHTQRAFRNSAAASAGVATAATWSDVAHASAVTPQPAPSAALDASDDHAAGESQRQ